MKKLVFLFLCAVLPTALWGQLVSIVDASDGSRGDSVDMVRYEVTYNLDAVVPSESDSDRYSERMLLQIGSRGTAFFSYVAYQVDSLVAAQIAHGGNVNVRATARVSWKLYANLPTVGQTVMLDRVCNDNFRVVEPVETPAWSLVPDSVTEVLGYRCQMAEARFKGRHWYAWYAADIPIDGGPWKIHGLPGLVLEAWDEGREYVFTAVGLANVNGSRNIYYKGKNSQEVGRRDLDKIRRRYYSDAVGYARMTFPQSSTSKISIVDGDGNEIMHSKPVPYNPIER